MSVPQRCMLRALQKTTVLLPRNKRPRGRKQHNRKKKWTHAVARVLGAARRACGRCKSARETAVRVMNKKKSMQGCAGVCGVKAAERPV